ncbi:hypothetical protein GVN20_29155 [Runella sp. CRIBMP]|uniref:hypothetical protein n=1 Tax=Runella sp. CRIBMP TaxID=2683261 RepID=UPI001412276F|nr:hypothetical protein [Runella sp. CRIBMP]NBB23455.1 hypothetical protein [Runella sp. CRIBMP]
MVEAKKYAQDISTDLRQTKIYAENIKATNEITLLVKWDKYSVPFLFSTNGRHTYSYREAVIDGYLIDHDPPYLIKTKLGEEGIEWKKEENPKYTIRKLS